MRIKNGVLTLTYGGMMAALVFVATYAFKIPISLTQGYIHLGDGFILLGAALLGWTAVPAAALGSMLADLLGGYTLYCLPTFLIKGAVAVVAVLAVCGTKPVWMTLALLAAAELVMVAGYFVVEGFFLFDVALALTSVPPNGVQALSGLVIGWVLLPAARRLRRRLS